ncbi:MAG: hypothetical protein DRJ97_04375 [Thermoprotei archaeon]|nr:MAG: hypothetical protein DRJ97_04375 [Thermoprotei archaeon]
MYKKVGYKTVKQIVGYRDEWVCVGETIKKKLVGYRTEKRLVGYKTEKVLKGYRKVLVGYEIKKTLEGYKDVKVLAGYRWVEKVVGYRKVRKLVEPGRHVTKTVYRKVKVIERIPVTKRYKVTEYITVKTPKLEPYTNTTYKVVRKVVYEHITTPKPPMKPIEVPVTH